MSYPSIYGKRDRDFAARANAWATRGPEDEDDDREEDDFDKAKKAGWTHGYSAWLNWVISGGKTMKCRPYIYK